MAILSVIASAIPGSTFFEGTAVSFGVPWIAISAGFNLMMTSLICYRIIRMRFQLRMFMEPEVKQMYTGVVAILVESALPLSIVGIIFAVLLGINQPYAVMVSGIWVGLVVCPTTIWGSTQLIFLEGHITTADYSSRRNGKGVVEQYRRSDHISGICGERDDEQ